MPGATILESFDNEPGRRLRQVRERLGLKYRDVEEATQHIAQLRGSQEFSIGLSRLADIENRGTVPSIYRLYSLCAIYGLSMGTVLGWYRIQVGKLPGDTLRMVNRRTRMVEPESARSLLATESAGKPPTGASDKVKAIDVATGGLSKVESLGVEVPLPPAGMDFLRTTYIGRQVQKWGSFPVGLLGTNPVNRRYAVVGTDDWRMYPLLWPGAFVQVDDRLRKPEPGPWTSDSERPIYLIEKRDGFCCGWCLQRGRTLIVQYHPASGAEPEHFITPDSGEVVGQVVGVAMRLDSVKRRRTRS